MNGVKRLFSTTAAALLFVTPLPAPERTVDDFFSEFTAAWIRADPNLATSTRYFTGDEQNKLEQQLTPETLVWRRDRIRRARQGLADLRKFDRSKMTETQRVSADVMQSQLDALVREEPYLDYTTPEIITIFPLNQLSGVNVSLVNALTVVHPIASENDAANYLAALGQVNLRMEEAIGESRRLATKGIIPPRFILQATIAQMRQLIASALLIIRSWQSSLSG